MGTLYNTGEDSMVLVIGEILYDLFPTYRRMGGAPFNFAFHLKQLGVDTRFVSRVGRDELGDDILAFVAAHGFDPDDIQVDDRRPTGRVEVAMAQDGSHNFSILENMAYDRIETTGRLAALFRSGPRAAYFGTLVQRTARSRETVKAMISALPAHTLKFCDINLRPRCWTRSVVDESMAAADILKLSHEELDILVPDKGTPMEERAAALLGPPGPGRVMVTMGSRGSFWATARGIAQAPEQGNIKIKIADTVGAGDAYAAMAAAALLSGIEDQRAMAMAHEFASGICTIKGALPPDPEFYTPFISRLQHGK
ncbi:MAG: hypothetical protein HUN04_23725 [Desulfobacter sp.]|nr:MAG: hypothetical protein HUN04_23725 [Desulfobacter sp.]